MVESFFQRVCDGNRRNSEQKPLILFFLIPERLQGDWYLSPNSQMALGAQSDAAQTSPVMLIKGEKQMVSDMSAGSTTQAQRLPLPLGKELERAVRLDPSGTEP